MSGQNGSTWVRWAVGMVVSAAVSWAAYMTYAVNSHLTRQDMAEHSATVHHGALTRDEFNMYRSLLESRLDRFERKLDQALEQDRPK